MMDKITLKQIEKEYGISRRAIQGYEKAELVKASGRTERGYLLYDMEAVNKIRKIRLYQELGFQIKEIREVFEASDERKRELISVKIELLMKKEEEIRKLIVLANELIEGR